MQIELSVRLTGCQKKHKHIAGACGTTQYYVTQKNEAGNPHHLGFILEELTGDLPWLMWFTHSPCAVKAENLAELISFAQVLPFKPFAVEGKNDA